MQKWMLVKSITGVACPAFGHYWQEKNLKWIIDEMDKMDTRFSGVGLVTKMLE
jgi:hypothetical protein